MCGHYPVSDIVFDTYYLTYMFLCGSSQCQNCYNTGDYGRATDALKSWNHQMRWIKDLISEAYDTGYLEAIIKNGESE